MPATLDEVKAAAAELSEEDRDELAAFLNEGVPPDHAATPRLSEDEWLTELKRRSAEIDAGTAVMTPWDEVRQRVARRVFGATDG